MNFEVLNTHVCKLTSYLLRAWICLLIYLGIDPLNSFLTVGIQGVAFRGAYVASPVKMVYSKSSVLKKVRLSVQAVHMEVTGIIINNKKRSMRESSFKDLEGMIGWLIGLEHLKPIAHSILTVYCKYAGESVEWPYEAFQQPSVWSVCSCLSAS